MHKWRIYDDPVYLYQENHNVYVSDLMKNVQSLDVVDPQSHPLMGHAHYSRSRHLDLKRVIVYYISQR